MTTIVVNKNLTKDTLHKYLVNWVSDHIGILDREKIGELVLNAINEHNNALLCSSQEVRSKKRDAFHDDSPDAAQKRARGSGTNGSKEAQRIASRARRARSLRKWRKKDAGTRKRTKNRADSVITKAFNLSKKRNTASVSSIVDSDDDDDIEGLTQPVIIVDPVSDWEDDVEDDM